MTCSPQQWSFYAVKQPRRLLISIVTKGVNEWRTVFCSGWLYARRRLMSLGTIFMLLSSKLQKKFGYWSGMYIMYVWMQNIYLWIECDVWCFIPPQVLVTYCHLLRLSVFTFRQLVIIQDSVGTQPYFAHRFVISRYVWTRSEKICFQLCFSIYSLLRIILIKSFV